MGCHFLLREIFLTQGWNPRALRCRRSLALQAVSCISLPAELPGKLVKNLPAIQEMQVQFLGWEDPLEKKMATYSSIFAWIIPWTEEPGGLQSLGVTKS